MGHADRRRDNGDQSRRAARAGRYRVPRKEPTPPGSTRFSETARPICEVRTAASERPLQPSSHHAREHADSLHNFFPSADGLPEDEEVQTRARYLFISVRQSDCVPGTIRSVGVENVARLHAIRIELTQDVPANEQDPVSRDRRCNAHIGLEIEIEFNHKNSIRRKKIIKFNELASM